MAKKKEFVYDVFISYSHQNQDWVKNTLLAKLEQVGLKVFIDYRDFELGESSPDAMERAVTTSKQTIIVLSPAYIKSNWGKFENLMLQVMDPANQERQLIPILLEKCKIPLRLSTFTYADLTKPEGVDLTWQKLFRALKVTIPAPVTPTTVTLVSRNTSHWYLAHPYPMSPNFTGRHAERNMLTGWLNNAESHPLLILRALGGFGKSSLTWHWLTQDVDASKWPKVIWWSFYEGDSNFENFLKEALKYINTADSEQLNPHQQTEALINLLQRENILLILDGFERAMRAYSNMSPVQQGDEQKNDKAVLQKSSRACISLYADTFLHFIATHDGHLRSKILMTTRLTPSVVEHENQMLQGCLEVELASMNRADAVKFFVARGVQGPGAEIEDICAAYGYHPLSLRLLAGLIINHPDKSRDIAIARKLNITDNIIQNKHHVLEHAYESLTQTQQMLLSDIACFRSSIDYKTLQVVEKRPETFRNDLQELIERGLLQHTKSIDKFDLHPIVRRYAYARMTQADRTVTHAQLRDYFLGLIASENPHVLGDLSPIVDLIAPRDPQALDNLSPNIDLIAPENPQTLDDLSPIIELYYHTLQAGEFDEAIILFRHLLATPLIYQFGAHEIRIELLRALFLDGEEKLHYFKNKSNQAWVLNTLASSFSASGQPRRAIPLLQQYMKILKEQEDQKTISVILTNLSREQFIIGSLQTAEANLRRSIQLCQEFREKLVEELDEAFSRQQLGHLLAYRGLWDEVDEELALSSKVWERERDEQGLGLDEAYRAIRSLLKTRDLFQSTVDDLKLAILHSLQALELAEERQRIGKPNVYDFIRAKWLLGAAYRTDGQLEQAELQLSEALMRDRAVNLVEVEAEILLDLARLRYDQENYVEAKSLAEEALAITERCGYVLQGADVSLFLAQYVLKQENDSLKAKAYAESALKLATCDGPPYYYKVAYEEAERMLRAL